MNAFAETLLGMNPGVLVLWKVTFILLIASTLHLALWKNHPQWHVLLWRGTWLGIIVTAVAAMALPAWEMKWLPNALRPTAVVDGTLPAVPQEALTELPSAPIVNSDIAMAAVPVAKQTFASSIWPKVDAPTIVFSLWTLVSLFLFARWGRNYLALARLRREAEPAPEKLTLFASKIADEMRYSRKPTVLVSRDIDSPCSVSVSSPVILLPNPEDPDMQAILAHEIAHLRSRDLLWIWLMDWLTACLWFHPMCWLMRREHLFACEAASDAAASDAIRDRESYSAALARIALTVCGNKPAATTAVSMARSSQIMKRLRLLKRQRMEANISSFKAGTATLLTIVAALGMGTMEFGLAGNQEEREPSSTRQAPATTKEDTGIVSRIHGVWKDEKGRWHRFTENGRHIEVTPTGDGGHFRTIEGWRKDQSKAEQLAVGLTDNLSWDEGVPVLHRKRPVKENLRLTKATPPEGELRNQLATESPEDEGDRRRLQGVWVARGGGYLGALGKFETWVRYAADGSATIVHWSEQGEARSRLTGQAFRLARFRGGWTLSNKVLQGMTSIEWKDDRTFIAQHKSYDESGLWTGAFPYEKADEEDIPVEVREFLFAEPSENNHRLLTGTWFSGSDVSSHITFREDGRWGSQISGLKNAGYWEATEKYIIRSNYQIYRILRLDETNFEYEVVPIDEKSIANPIKRSFRKEPKSPPSK